MALVLSLLLALPPQALAQSFAVGYAKYQRGDFKGAEQALVQALRNKPASGETAKILKILGISQYMLGNRNAAATSFAKALTISPSLKISGSEVLDESVIAFFEKQRGSLASPGKREVASARGSSNRTSKKTPPSPQPKQTPPPRSAASRDGNGASLAKKTVLKVQSNVANAQISIDGILAGRPGEFINTDPGSVPVEVKAPGYITRNVNVTITKDRENTVTINLEKVPPPQPPKPKPKPMAVAVAKPSGQASGKNSGARPGKPSSSRATTRGGGNAALAPDGDDLFAPAPNDDMFYDQKNQANGTPPGAGGAPDLASEFERDAAAAAAPPPMAPGYPTAAPAYPQAGAAPQYSAPVQPAPQAYMPPQPVYPYGAPPAYYGGFAPAPMYAPPPVYQPPPAYAPPPEPMMDPGMQNAQPPSPGYNDPAPLPDPAYSDAEVAGSYGGPSPKRTSTRIVYLMPFGLGQFAQKRPIAGLFFAAAEAGLLFGAYYNYSEAQTATKEGKAYKAACDSDPDCDKQIAEEDIKYFNQQMKQANTYMLACLVGAGLTAFAGAIEALMHAHDPGDSGKNSKKRSKGRPSKKRKYKGFTGLSPTPTNLSFSLWDDQQGEEQSAWAWGLKVSPYPLTNTRIALPSIMDKGLSGDPSLTPESALAPSLLLDVTWTF